MDCGCATLLGVGAVQEANSAAAGNEGESSGAGEEGAESSASIEGKVARVCDALREAMLAAGPRRYFKAVLTSLAKVHTRGCVTMLPSSLL